MKRNNNNPKPTWRIWLIKKLLNNHNNKDDILKVLSESFDLNIKNDNFLSPIDFKGILEIA